MNSSQGPDIMKLSAYRLFFIPVPRISRIAAAIACAAILLAGTATVTPGEAADCGGKGQKACPALNKGPQCNQWLRKVKGICRPCGGKNQQSCPVLAKGKVCKDGLKRKKGVCKPDRDTALRDQAKIIEDKLEPLLTNLSNLRQCLANSSRKAKLRAAIKGKDAGKAEELVNQCLSDNMRHNLRRKPQGLAIGTAARSRGGDDDVDNKFFNTLSIGVGAGVMFVVGGAADAGVVIDLTRKKHVRIYSSAETAFGAGANIGADLIVGLGRDPLRRGKYKNIAVVGAGKYLAGGAVAIVFDYGEPSLELFDGIAVSGGAGAGAEIGTIHKSESRIWGVGCKNVEITATNDSDHEVKITDLDYHDYEKNKWYSKLTMNSVLKDKGAWVKTRRLKAVGLDETQIRIRYKLRKKGTKEWGKEKRAWSKKQVCEEGSKFAVSLK